MQKLLTQSFKIFLAFSVGRFVSDKISLFAPRTGPRLLFVILRRSEQNER